MSVQPLSTVSSGALAVTVTTGSQQSPAAALTGQTLPSGWRLVQQLSKSPGGSGSNFCVGYVAERDGRKAFVKAIDFVKALNAVDPIAELAQLTSLATFEREAMELCEAQNLSRLIRLLSFEYVNFDSTKNPLNQVYCLIMEIGAGDLRKQLSQVGVFSCSAVFGILADVALGLSQLHPPRCRPPRCQTFECYFNDRLVRAQRRVIQSCGLGAGRSKRQERSV